MALRLMSDQMETHLPNSLLLRYVRWLASLRSSIPSSPLNTFQTDDPITPDITLAPVLIILTWQSYCDYPGLAKQRARE